MADSPEKAAKQQKKAQRAQKAITVASVVVPEARAAKAGMAAKARTAKGAASAGEKGAKKAASARTKAPSKASGKTASKPQAKPEPAKARKPETPEARKSGSKRAVQYAKRETGRRVQSGMRSVKSEHQKTSSAVRGKYRRDKVVGLAEMRPKTRMLAAEYMAAIIIAVIFLFVSDKSYHEKMSRFFVQLTGVTGIFFFLALLGNSEKAGKWVVPFGLLIDLSMIGFLMRSHGGDVITRSLGGTPKTPPPGSGGPEPTNPGGPVKIISAETYNAPHPGGSGIPAGTEAVWPGTGSPLQGGIVA